MWTCSQTYNKWISYFLYWSVDIKTPQHSQEQASDRPCLPLYRWERRPQLSEGSSFECSLLLLRCRTDLKHEPSQTAVSQFRPHRPRALVTAGFFFMALFTCDLCTDNMSVLPDQAVINLLAAPTTHTHTHALHPVAVSLNDNGNTRSVRSIWSQWQGASVLLPHRHKDVIVFAGHKFKSRKNPVFPRWSWTGRRKEEVCSRMINVQSFPLTTLQNELSQHPQLRFATLCHACFWTGLLSSLNKFLIGEESRHAYQHLGSFLNLSSSGWTLSSYLKEEVQSCPLSRSNLFLEHRGNRLKTKWSN